MFNWIVSYREKFNYVQRMSNTEYKIVLNSNDCNHYTICKQMINID